MQKRLTLVFHWTYIGSKHCWHVAYRCAVYDNMRDFLVQQQTLHFEYPKNLLRSLYVTLTIRYCNWKHLELRSNMFSENENRARRTMLFPLSVSWWMILRMIMFCWFVLINTVCWRLRRQAFMYKKINTFDILISLSLSLSTLIILFLTLRVNYNV